MPRHRLPKFFASYSRQICLLSFLLAAFTLCAANIAAQTTPPQDTAPPPDKPVAATSDDVAKYEAAIAPYILKARDSLPDTKKRFLAGLPQGQILYVTVRLTDPQGRFEQAYVKVNSWTGTIIKGTLASDMDLVKKYKKGEALTCRDSQVMDWTITKPNGTEEGNFVGKFLETYKPEK
jgi:Uncharacterized protein conserved in bacteria (DUF2314)